MINKGAKKNQKSTLNSVKEAYAFSKRGEIQEKRF